MTRNRSFRQTHTWLAMTFTLTVVAVVVTAWSAGRPAPPWRKSEVAVVWNVVSRLADAFDFALRECQLEKGTQALHAWAIGSRRF